MVWPAIGLAGNLFPADAAVCLYWRGNVNGGNEDCGTARPASVL